MYPRASKVLLLDMDGVIFHHPRALEHVGKKVTSLVKKVVPSTATMLDAHQINRKLYTSYGHTLLGLRAVYRNDVPTLDEFNKEVYDDQTLSYLELIRKSPEVQAKKMEVERVLEIARVKNIPIYIFSNAPLQWCQGILNIMDVCEYFHEDSIFCSSHPVFQDSLLKPQPQLYRSVQDLLQHVHQDGSMELVFVDDSWSNVMPVIGSMGWKPIFLSGNVEGKITSQWVQTIHTIGDVVPLI